MKTLTALLFLCQGILMAQTPAASRGWSWFSEAGAASGNNISGGLGIAMDAKAGQQLFGEIALETDVAQSSQLLIGIKSNYPGVTIRGHKLTPFSIVAYGASIQSLTKPGALSQISLGSGSPTIASIATSAGFAQQYAGGIETPVGSWTLGIGFSGDKTASGWKGLPFIFLGKSF
jgi:hypothetical protein